MNALKIIQNKLMNANKNALLQFKLYLKSM